MATVEDLGRKLLAEVEEILHKLRLDDQDADPHSLNCSPLDRLVKHTSEQRPGTAGAYTNPPIIELCSLHPGGGSTHLAHYLCARAVLPTDYSGSQACVVVLDLDGAFSISTLASQLKLLIRPHQKLEEDERETSEDALSALKHVHVFRPQTLASAIATVDSLRTYLFDSGRHFSSDRPLGLIIVEAASAFYWQDRAESEDAAFLAKTATVGRKSVPSQTEYTRLASSLKTTSKAFMCAVVISAWHLGPAPLHQQHSPSARSFRSLFSGPFASLPTLRLVARRVPVRKFPAGISVSEALREADDRQKAVEENKFECFVNGWGLDERTANALSEAGFHFKVTRSGVVLAGD